jgi:hypothetical protein
VSPYFPCDSMALFTMLRNGPKGCRPRQSCAASTITDAAKPPFVGGLAGKLKTNSSYPPMRTSRLISLQVEGTGSGKLYQITSSKLRLPSAK